MTWARMSQLFKLVVQQLSALAKMQSTEAQQATTNTLPLKIIDFVEGPDSAIGDAKTDVLVMFNVGHQLLNTTGIG